MSYNKDDLKIEGCKIEDTVFLIPNRNGAMPARNAGHERKVTVRRAVRRVRLVYCSLWSSTTALPCNTTYNDILFLPSIIPLFDPSFLRVPSFLPSSLPSFSPPSILFLPPPSLPSYLLYFSPGISPFLPFFLSFFLPFFLPSFLSFPFFYFAIICAEMRFSFFSLPFRLSSLAEWPGHRV